MEHVAKEKKQWSWLTAKFCVAVITFVIGVGAYWVACWTTTSTPPQLTPPAPVDTTSADPGTLRATLSIAGDLDKRFKNSVSNMRQVLKK